MNKLFASLIVSVPGLMAGRIAAAEPASAASNLLGNGGFERGMEEWIPLWTRDKAAGQVVIDEADRHGGSRAARVDYRGRDDWSLAHGRNLAVKAGEIYELAAWVRLQGGGSASLGVVTRDAQGHTLAWDHGGRRVAATKDWRPVVTRFVVPVGATTIQTRLIGYGAAMVHVDDVVLRRQGSLDTLRDAALPEAVTFRGGTLEVTVRTRDGGMEVTDRKGKRTWRQLAGEVPLAVLRASAGAAGIELEAIDPAGMRQLRASIRVDDPPGEIVVTIASDGEMRDIMQWPPPFASAAGETLVVPVNEGIGYPVDDASLPTMNYHLYGGHGLCMPWYGAADDGGAGWMAIVETADDAAVRIPRHDGLLVLAPEWQSQKGAFGPLRVIRYAFFTQGGHVAMAKRYRGHAKANGLLRTLAEKRRSLPAVDLLVGAVNVWCWDKDAPGYCREMRKLGIERIQWSNARPPEELKALNEMGVLTSRYDIYQDAMNPAEFPKLRWLHQDWTSDAWRSDDLMIGAGGEWVRGWEVETKDGSMIPCGTLCDRQAVAYAKRRIPAELATHPYRCRFIDTTTASPWRECYHPKHPLTRSESKRWKMELLRYISEGCGLVCGSETGHDAAVPFVHYFEGMLSLGPYRVPDSGRDMARIWHEVPENVAKFQTGHRYRLPLWELVYHDCVVAQWYWGDYNNKLPALWDRRDLWNALYGTPPMFMFDRKTWEANKERFAKSYRTVVPVARATGYSEMLTHEWLTPDRAVQRTRFANGMAVTVNFGDSPFALPDGRRLPPLGCVVEQGEQVKDVD